MSLSEVCRVDSWFGDTLVGCKHAGNVMLPGPVCCVGPWLCCVFTYVFFHLVSVAYSLTGDLQCSAALWQFLLILLATCVHPALIVVLKRLLHENVIFAHQSREERGERAWRPGTDVSLINKMHKNTVTKNVSQYNPSHLQLTQQPWASPSAVFKGSSYKCLHLPHPPTNTQCMSHFTVTRLWFIRTVVCAVYAMHHIHLMDQECFNVPLKPDSFNLVLGVAEH